MRRGVPKPPYFRATRALSLARPRSMPPTTAGGCSPIAVMKKNRKKKKEEPKRQKKTKIKKLEIK
jgi:hypothetical protein